MISDNKELVNKQNERLSKVPFVDPFKTEGFFNGLKNNVKRLYTNSGNKDLSNISIKKTGKKRFKQTKPAVEENLKWGTPFTDLPKSDSLRLIVESTDIMEERSVSKPKKSSNTTGKIKVIKINNYDAKIQGHGPQPFEGRLILNF